MARPTEPGRAVPSFIDRLTARLRVAPVRPSDADYQAELRSQLVRMAVTERIKTLQRQETAEAAALQAVRKADGMDTRSARSIDPADAD